MRRYFFDFHDGQGSTTDEEGQGYPNAAAIRFAADRAIGEMIGAAIAHGVQDYRGKLSVRDDSSSVILTVGFDCRTTAVTEAAETMPRAPAGGDRPG